MSLEVPSLDDLWQHYREETLPPDMAAAEVAWHQRSFYGGMLVMLAQSWAASNQSRAQFNYCAQQWRTELTTFIVSIDQMAAKES